MVEIFQTREEHCIATPLVAQKIGSWSVQELLEHTPKTEGLLLIIRRVFSLPDHPKGTSPRLPYWFQTIIDRSPPQKRMPLIWEGRIARHFKWWEGEQVGIVDKLLLQKEDSKRRVNKANHEGEQQGSPYPVNVAPIFISMQFGHCWLLIERMGSVLI